MTSVVRGMDKAMESMNLERVRLLTTPTTRCIRIRHLTLTPYRIRSASHPTDIRSHGQIRIPILRP